MIKIKLIMRWTLPLPETLSRIICGKISVPSGPWAVGPNFLSLVGISTHPGFLPLLPGSAIQLPHAGVHRDKGAVSHVLAWLFSLCHCLQLNSPPKRFWIKRRWVYRTVCSQQQLSWQTPVLLVWCWLKTSPCCQVTKSVSFTSILSAGKPIASKFYGKYWRMLWITWLWAVWRQKQTLEFCTVSNSRHMFVSFSAPPAPRWIVWPSHPAAQLHSTHPGLSLGSSCTLGQPSLIQQHCSPPFNPPWRSSLSQLHDTVPWPCLVYWRKENSNNCLPLNQLIVSL